MFVRFLLLAASALPLSALAQDASPPAVEQVVITGQSLESTKKALDDCIARECRPDQEIAAAIAHAENQFVAGRYTDAKATLSQASRRNKRYARQYPVPVSDMLRAKSRVAAHLGEGQAYFSAALDVVSALKAGLPEEDSRVLVARAELASAFARFGRFQVASNLYLDVAGDAKRLNLPVVEGFARLRDAALWSALALENPAFRSKARAKLATLAAITDPAQAPFAKQAKVLQARLNARDGDASGVDALIAEYRAQPVKRPVLLSSPTIKLRPMRRTQQGESVSVTALMSTENYEGQWIDVSFWIAPDGRTTDVGILRDSGKTHKTWTDPVLEAIRGRRYAPLALDPADPGLLRVERYTYTSDWTDATGSRIRVRGNQPRVEMLDLSIDSPKPAS